MTQDPSNKRGADLRLAHDPADLAAAQVIGAAAAGLKAGAAINGESSRGAISRDCSWQSVIRGGFCWSRACCNAKGGAARPDGTYHFRRSDR